MSAQEKPTAQRFVSHGSFAVMPLSFPSVTVPIDPDESLFTALDVARDGLAVVGGTSGRRVHLFVAYPKPPAGVVMDLGTIDDATEARTVIARGHRLFAALNGPAGGRVVTQWIPSSIDGIQEWSAWRPRLDTLAALPGERILDLHLAPDASVACCMTDRRVVRIPLSDVPTELSHLNFKEPVSEREIHEIVGADVADPAVSRFARAHDGLLYATLTGGKLMRIEIALGQVEEAGAELPFSDGGWGWASGKGTELIAADADGELFAFTPETQSVAPAGSAPLGPVKCMGSLVDGRSYGLCGEGIGRMFRYDSRLQTATDLGAVAGVLGVKRYAYTFRDAVVGPDGEIYFAEDDRGGHLWIYFPPIS